MYDPHNKTEKEEEEFASVWQKINDQENILEYLMSDSNNRHSVTDEQAEVAATVIQWLGTHVGQSFLMDMGFERVPRAHPLRWWAGSA